MYSGFGGRSGFYGVHHEGGNDTTVGQTLASGQRADAMTRYRRCWICAARDLTLCCLSAVFGFQAVFRFIGFEAGGCGLSRWGLGGVWRGF